MNLSILMMWSGDENIGLGCSCAAPYMHTMSGRRFAKHVHMML